MHTALLLIALAGGQELTDPAAFHPADAELYLAIPDVRAADVAYRAAPLNEIVGDERVAKLLDSLGVPLPERLAIASLGELLAEVGYVPEDLGALLSEALAGAGALSMSLAGAVGSAGWEQDFERLRRARADLGALDERIDAYRARTGALPGTLDALDDADAVEREDPWGGPYVYEPSADGASFELRTLGNDQEPGGRFAARDLEVGFDLAERLLACALARVRLQLVFDVGDVERVDALRAALASAPGVRIDESPLARFEHAGLEIPVHRVTHADVPDFEAWLATFGQHVVFGVGADTQREAVLFAGRSAAGAGALAGDARFTRARAELGEPMGTTVLAGYQSVSLLELIAALVEPLDAIDERATFARGVARLASFWSGGVPVSSAWRTDLANDVFTTTTFTHDNATPAGVDRWLAARELDLAGGPPIPADAMLVYATTVDGEALGAHVLEWLGSGSGFAPEQWITRIEESHGVHVGRDLFANLGGRLFAVVQPPSGVAVPQAFAYLEVADAERLWPALQSFARFVGEQLAGELELKERTYRDVELLMLELAASDAVQPTFAILDGRLVVALDSKHVKREIKRLEERAEERAEKTAEEGADGAANADRAHPIYAAAAKADSQRSEFFMDWPGLIAAVHRLAATFGPMAAGFADLPIDLTQLPPADVLTGPLRPSRSRAVAVEGGTRTVAVSSFGPETPWLLAAAAVLASRDEGGADGEPAEGADEEPAVEPDDAADAVARTRRGFLELRNGLAVHRVEFGRYPAELESLVEPTESYPRGFLDGAALPEDGWGRSYRYQASEGGRSYRLWSAGRNGEDEGGAGDDLTADG